VVELRSRDADRTQETILRAAMSEFAERGLGGARVDRIADRAGINTKLIYYYFGNRRTFPGGARNHLCDIRQAERALNLEALAPADAVAPAGELHLAALSRSPRVPQPAQQRKTCIGHAT